MLSVVSIAHGMDGADGGKVPVLGPVPCLFAPVMRPEPPVAVAVDPDLWRSKQGEFLGRTPDGSDKTNAQLLEAVTSACSFFRERMEARQVDLMLKVNAELASQDASLRAHGYEGPVALEAITEESLRNFMVAIARGIVSISSSEESKDAKKANILKLKRLETYLLEAYKTTRVFVLPDVNVHNIIAALLWDKFSKSSVYSDSADTASLDYSYFQNLGFEGRSLRVPKSLLRGSDSNKSGYSYSYERILDLPRFNFHTSPYNPPLLRQFDIAKHGYSEVSIDGWSMSCGEVDEEKLVERAVESATIFVKFEEIQNAVKGLKPLIADLKAFTA